MTTNKDDIELEASLLNTLAIQKNYDKFINVIEKKYLLPITKDILESYRMYYAKYNSDIQWDVFYTDYILNKKDFDDEDFNYYKKTVIPLIRDSQNGNHVYKSLLEREAIFKINEIVEKGFEVNVVQDIITGLKTQLQLHSNTNNEDIFKLSQLDLSVLDNSNGLSWFLPALQAGIGSHMPGQFVLVSADSNAGKSAFCISQAVHVFRQINNNSENRPILYCTSEDTKEDLAGRFLSNLYKDRCVGGFEEVISRFEKVSGHFAKQYNDELFIGMNIRGSKDIYRIRDKIEKFNPCLIIIDMADVLSESLDIQCLTKTYNQIRSIANDGVPVIGTTQAGDTSYRTEDGQFKHRKWLTEKHTSGSKGGGKQGAAYCMIMIGIDDDMPGVRYLTTTKKKRGRNVSLTCQLDERYSLYKELL